MNVNNTVYKPAFYIGILLMAIGVVLGALGAHALKPDLMQFNLLDSFETAVRYQLFHGIALLIIGILSLHSKHRNIKICTITFLIGTLFFSGSIYFLIFNKIAGGGGIGKLGLITPIGGILLITSWMLLIPIIRNLIK